MASSSSKYRPKVRKDKLVVVKEDKKRYFSTVTQMENYGNYYYHRRLIEPKIMNLESFIDSRLYFH